MILWFAAGAVVGVWSVFRSSGLDFRAVALGALLPQAVDAPFGRQACAHTLAASVVLLAGVMALTAGRGRRLLRRRLLGLPIGSLCGLVLAGTWADREVFWWPAFGAELPHVDLLAPWPVVAVEELLGLGAAVWVWRRFGLADPARRTALVRHGRLTPAEETPLV